MIQASLVSVNDMRDAWVTGSRYGRRMADVYGRARLAAGYAFDRPLAVPDLELMVRHASR